MNRSETEKCWQGFVKWCDGGISEGKIDLWHGWRAAYSYILVNKKEEFDEMIDEMYNDYKQENLKGE